MSLAETKKRRKEYVITTCFCNRFVVYFSVSREMLSYLLTVSPYSSKRKWKHGKRSMILRSAQMRSFLWRSVTKIASRRYVSTVIWVIFWFLFRKSMTIKSSVKRNVWMPTITISLPKIELMRRKRFKKLFSFQNKKKLSKQKWSSNRTTRRNVILCLKSKQRIEWRIRS